MVAGRIERLLHRKRDPKVERVADKSAMKFLRGDANDRMLHAVQVLRSADDVWVGPVTILPRSVADHHHRMRVAPFTLFGSEAAAENRFYSKRVEIISRHNSRRRALGSIAHAKRCAGDLVDNERLEQR